MLVFISLAILFEDLLCACVSYLWDTCWSCIWSFATLNVWLNDAIFYIYFMIIHLLGDECMLLISIILSAPPRCMWHGRVTHEPNSLCICSPKQILKLCTNLGGALAYHILLKATMVFKFYYHLSKLWSICCHQLPKRGRLKVQLSLGGFCNS